MTDGTGRAHGNWPKGSPRPRCLRWGGLFALVAVSACDGGRLLSDLNVANGGAGGWSGTGGPAGTTGTGGTGGSAGTGGTGGTAGTGGGAGSAGTGGMAGTGGGPPPVGMTCPVIDMATDQFNPCGETNSLAYSPDGRLLAAGMSGAHPNVHVWRVADGALAGDIDGIGSRTLGVAFSPDSTILATAGEQRDTGAVVPDIVKLWDVASGSLLRTLPATCGFYAGAMAFTRDGMRIATAGYLGPVEIWRVSDGTLVQSIPYSTSVHNLRFSPDDSQVVVAGVDHLVTFWNVSDGTLAMTLSGIADEMSDAAFAPDGHQIATTGLGNEIKIWDVATGTLLQSLSGHTSYVSHVLWIDQNNLVSNDWGGTIKLWTRGDGGFSWSKDWSIGGSMGIARSPNQRVFAAGGYLSGTSGFVFLQP